MSKILKKLFLIAKKFGQKFENMNAEKVTEIFLLYPQNFKLKTCSPLMN